MHHILQSHETSPGNCRPRSKTVDSTERYCMVFVQVSQDCFSLQHTEVEGRPWDFFLRETKHSEVRGKL